MTRKRKSTEPYTDRHVRRLAKQEASLLLKQIDEHLNPNSSSVLENPQSDLLCQASSSYSDHNSINEFNDSANSYRYSSSDNESIINNEPDENINILLNRENEDTVNHKQVERNNIEVFKNEINKSERQKATDFKQSIVSWALGHKITHAAISELLIILNIFTDVSFPKDPRTLLKTPVQTHIENMGDGQYCHIGLKEAINKLVQKRKQLDYDISNIELLINIDGAPIGKSCEKSLWPILCSDTILKEVHIVGIFCGVGKPNDPNEFLKMFVSEATDLINNGYSHENVQLQVKIHALVCDAPAKAYILGIKYHSGYNSCTKCIIEGEYIDQCICFPGPACVLRTDEGFKNNSYNDDYQVKETILSTIPNLGLVSQVVLDYLHLVCLGIMRKLLLLWIRGPLGVRLSAFQQDTISELMKKLRNCIPSEFARKPTSLQFIKIWKATEFRNFLLYIGPVILQGILKEPVYINFLTLHVAISILASPVLVLDSQNILYAEELLKHFVESFEMIYGTKYVSHNVHNLLHLARDVQNFGHLDAFSAFRFENYIFNIKKFLRKGELPLSQIARRIGEVDNNASLINVQKKDLHNMVLDKPHSSGPLLDDRNYSREYKILQMKTYTIKCDESNNCVLLENGVIVQALNFAVSENELYIIGKELINTSESLYSQPCESTKIGIKIVTDRRSEIKAWPCKQVYGKNFKMPFRNKSFLVGRLQTTVFCTMYTIVEFDDGVEMIPSNWLIEPEEKKCLWPPYNDQIKIRKAIATIETPSADWGLCDIRRIFARAESHTVAVEKLKLAEKLSDIDDTIDSDTWRKTRKTRAKRNLPLPISSDEERADQYNNNGNSQNPKYNLPNFPKVPANLSYNKTSTNESQSKSNKNQKSKLVMTVKKSNVTKNTTKTKVQAKVPDSDKSDAADGDGGSNEESHGGEENIIHGIQRSDTNDMDDTNTTKILPKHGNTKPSMIQTQNTDSAEDTCEDLVEHDTAADTNNESIPEPAIPPLNNQNEKLDYLIKLTRKLVAKQSAMNVRLHSMERSITELKKRKIPTTSQDKDDMNNEIEKLFPLDTEDKLEAFENKLNDQNETFKPTVIRYFRNRGGKDVRELIVTILKKVFSDDLALKYSYLGQKNKKKFCALRICQCIEKAAELYDADVKEKEIKDYISKWLVQANLRIKNMEKKRNRHEEAIQSDHHDGAS